ncbi:hypothetical protein WH47_07571 [Habropoda laboriosa]|uniref:Histone-lysine N-methyltransferase SETMAR n=1 Tax=Habropoda laboriosa TaxID=597456 RepID=A0A0L7RE77_9HYME|nr:hypothetical protein WH47_07571 [Habropoda laboriosa]
MQKLRRLDAAISRKCSNRRHEALLHQSNARLHIANLTKMVIQDLRWKILRHPPYPLNRAPKSIKFPHS